MSRNAHDTDRDRDRNADAGERWWPSPFGKDDQQGMFNHLTDAKLREALALVGQGWLYELGRILDEQARDPNMRSRATRLITSPCARDAR